MTTGGQRAEGGGQGQFSITKVGKTDRETGLLGRSAGMSAPRPVSGSPRESKAPRRVAIEKMYGASGGKGLLRATTTGLTPFATRGGGRREASSV